jgi:hypothetical protein
VLLGLGLLIFVAPLVRADLILSDANFHWDAAFDNVTWGVVADSYPLNDWLLPSAQRSSLTPGWTITPTTYTSPPGDGSLWNTHWAVSGIVGNSDLSVPTPTEFKLGNNGLSGSTSEIEIQWRYSDPTFTTTNHPMIASDLTLTGWNGSTPVTAVYNAVKSTGMTYNSATGNGGGDLTYDFNAPVQWDDFVWTYPTGSNDWIHDVIAYKDVTVVPEPGSMALLMLGLPFVGLLRRRKAA